MQSIITARHTSYTLIANFTFTLFLLEYILSSLTQLFCGEVANFTMLETLTKGPL